MVINKSTNCLSKDQFVDFYYQAFDSNRSSLGNLYRDQSMLTFEREQFVGAVNIVEKLSVSISDDQQVLIDN